MSDRYRYGTRVGRRNNTWLHLEKVEQVLDVQALLVDVPRAQQKPLRHAAAASKGSGEKSERANGDDSVKTAAQNNHVSGVVSHDPKQREQRGGNAFTNGETAVSFIETARELSVAAYQPLGKTEHLDFFGGLVSGTQKTQIVQLPAFRRHAIEQGIFQRAEMSFSEEAG